MCLKIFEKIFETYHLFDLNAPLFSNIFMTGNLHKNAGNLNEITSISFKLAAFLCHDTAVVGNFYGKFCIKFCGCIIYLISMHLFSAISLYMMKLWHQLVYISFDLSS